MKPELAFVCPLTRDDLLGSGALRHCPECNLNIPDMSALTADEARRVLDALRCAHERSQDLHFCSSYQLDARGDAIFLDPKVLDALNVDLSHLFDTTPRLLLAIAVMSALGVTAHLEIFHRYVAPAWEGHPVFVLDEEGPRLEPERAHAFAGAVDASEDAWLTLNLAAWRRGIAGIMAPTIKFEKANVSVEMGIDF